MLQLFFFLIVLCLLNYDMTQRFECMLSTSIASDIASNFGDDDGIVLKLKPHSHIYKWNCGILLIDQEKYELALQQFKDAAKLD